MYEVRLLSPIAPCPLPDRCGLMAAGERDNPEPIKLVLVLITVVAALVFGAWVYYRVAV